MKQQNTNSIEQDSKQQANIMKQQDVDGHYQHQYIQPIKQQHQLTILINQCQTIISQQLIEQFRNDHIVEVNPHLIIGTTSQITDFTEGMLNNGTIAELVEVTLCRLLVQFRNKQKYYSALMRKQVTATIKQSNTCQNVPQNIRYSASRDAINEKKKDNLWTMMQSDKLLQFQPQMLSIRRSYNYYLQQLQNNCLAISLHNDMIQSCVICAGNVYGCGQLKLFVMFKKNLQQSDILQNYGTGTNYIPMIHCKDLVKIVADVAFKMQGQLKQKYYFAVDDACSTQKEVLQSIADAVGVGQLHVVPIQCGFLESQFLVLNVDLKIKRNIDINDWHCKSGFVKNIAMIVEQFNTFRGLKANKILVLGTPASGKSQLSNQLAKIYGLPIIRIQQLLQTVKKSTDQEAQKLQKQFQELRLQKVQQQKKVYEQMKKKKKGKAVQQFDGQKIVVNLNNENLCRLLKWRLSISDCRNKGYILDALPKSYAQAMLLFMKKSISQQQSEQLDMELMPNSVFYFDVAEDDVRKRLKELPLDIVNGTHWSEEQNKRRFQNYVKNNQEQSLKSFFQGKVDIMNVPFNYDSFEQFSKFIQRNGPLGFKKTYTQEQLQQKQKEKEKQQKQQQLQSQQNRQLQQLSSQQVLINEQFDIDKLTAAEHKILNEKSRPIRQYLIDNVIPHITEGLLEICQETPTEPIKHLIDFLQTKKKKDKKSIRQ